MGFWESRNKTENEKVDGDSSMSDMPSIDFGEVLDISFAVKLHSQFNDDVKKNSTINFITLGLTPIDASCLHVPTSFMGDVKKNDISIH